MKYNLAFDDQPRTSSYRFTVKKLDDPSLTALKKSIIENNKQIRSMRRKYNRTLGKLMRVSIMPRGPRAAAAVKDYNDKMTTYMRSYQSYLPQRHATHFDVYVQDDSYAEYQWNRELETGLSPGQLKKADAAQHEIWKKQWEVRDRLRGSDIVWNHIKDTYTSEEVLNADIAEKWANR